MDQQNNRTESTALPTTIICKCECGERKSTSWSIWGVFTRVFAAMTAFMMSLFMPFFVLIFFFIVLAAIGASVSESQVDGVPSYDTEYVYGDRVNANKLLQVPITGIILGDRSDGTDFSSFLSGGLTYGYDVKDYLRWAAKQEDIKGVVLLINSPGGTVVGSQAVADAVEEYRVATNKPVYAHISGVGASGAYWSAVSTDEVYADAGSITGSIGVIMGSVLYYDTPVAYGNSFGESVDTENGIKEYSIAAGKGKDFGNPFRAPTDEELAVYRTSVNNEYSRFVDYISKRRAIDVQIVRDQIGAYVYDNTMAEQLRLIDGSHMRELTYELLGKNAGFERNFQVVSLRGSSFLEQLFAQAKSFVPHATKDRSEVLKASSFCMPKVVVAFHGDYNSFCR